MVVPLTPPVPRIEVTTFPGHPVLSSLVDTDTGLSLLVLREDNEHCYVLDTPDVDARRHYAATASEIELYKLVIDAIYDDGIWNVDLAEMAVDYWSDDDLELWASPRSERGVHTPTLALNARADRNSLVNAEYCRDDDCNGSHIWWGVEFNPGFGRRGYFVWHINTESGQVVPPLPMVVTLP